MGIDNVRVGMNDNPPLLKAYVVSRACILPDMSDIPFATRLFQHFKQAL
jgi:hypothetical protein